ncbi:MAG: hypothetical protein ABI365_02960 [Lysobacteraceae bacterium]
MNLENISRISEIISSVAVVVSLVYVGLQVRQNTRALRATTYNAVTANSIAILTSMDTHPEYSEFLVRVQSGYDAATPAEKLRFHMCLLSAFRHWDNLLYQFRNGMLEREMWESYDRTMTSWLGNAAWRNWFLANAASFSDSLQALLHSRISMASPIQ